MLRCLHLIQNALVGELYITTKFLSSSIIIWINFLNWAILFLLSFVFIFFRITSEALCLLKYIPVCCYVSSLVWKYFHQTISLPFCIFLLDFLTLHTALLSINHVEYQLNIPLVRKLAGESFLFKWKKHQLWPLITL